MTEDQIRAANTKIDFTGVEEATGSNMTMPGTIATFKITDGEFVSSKDKGTPGLKCAFEEEQGSSFSHTFWLTENAISRVQHLAKHATGEKWVGQLDVNQMIASLKGKFVHLKVGAQINEKNGRVYPDLAFGGFSADTLEELKFNARELETIEKGKALASQTNVNNADTETAATPAPAAAASPEQADDF